MAGKVTLRDVKEGFATVQDLQRINAILDMQKEMEAVQQEKANRK